MTGHEFNDSHEFNESAEPSLQRSKGLLSRVQQIRMHLIENELKTPFVAANAVYKKRQSIIVEVVDQNGLTGYGEGVAFEGPWYTEETVETAWHMLDRYMIPLLLEADHPVLSCSEVHHRLLPIKGNPMAKASLDMAFWDLEAKQHGQSLSQYIGGVRQEIQAGVAVGLQPTSDQLISLIERYIEEGYERVKLKISPSQDVSVVEPVRNRYPDLAIMADANSSYSLSQIDRLQQLDSYQLLMIEQPFGEKDWLAHARLQAVLQTPVCLDESISSAADAQLAIELQSCRTINVKLGRVGGYTEALKIDQLARRFQLPLWCGGMLESGIGRAHSIALASLATFRYPGDIGASSRYWERDIVTPSTVVRQGRIIVPKAPGIGVEIDREYMESLTLRSSVYTK